MVVTAELHAPAFTEVDETFNSIVNREFGANHLRELGRQGLLGADVALASEYAAVIDRAIERNRTLINTVGATAVKSMASPEVGTTLHERLDLSANGDKQAAAAIDIDALTEVIEQMCKAGAVLKVKAKINQAGAIEQFGQTTEMRQRNTLDTYSLKKSALRDTIFAEGQNGFFIEEANRNGLLKGKRIVEFSLIPEDSHQTLAKHGYYLREVIGIIRVTTIKGDNCEIISVLVGGTDQDRLPSVDNIKTEREEDVSEQLALAQRFDIKAVRKIYAGFGRKHADRLTTDQLLADPLIVPDSYDHLDMAMLFDQYASEIVGKPLLLGLPTKYDYSTKADYKAREAASLDFQSKLRPIAKQVAAEAIQRRHEVDGSIATARLFREVAKKHAVKYLVQHETTDTRVFGAQTFHLVAQARKSYEAGDYAAARQFESRAQEKARSSGCPGDTEDSGSSLKTLFTKLRDTLLGKDSEGLSELEKRVGKITKDKCIVPGCPTNPRKVDVGECRVCIERCQKIYDKGGNPEELRPVEKAKKVVKTVIRKIMDKTIPKAEQGIL